MSDPSLENSSNNMSGRRIFELIITSAAADGSAARLGKLSLPGRKAIETPNFIAATSRGSVPHLTPDNFKRHTTVSGVYMALEECETNVYMYEEVTRVLTVINSHREKGTSCSAHPYWGDFTSSA